MDKTLTKIKKVLYQQAVVMKERIFQENAEIDGVATQANAIWKRLLGYEIEAQYFDALKMCYCFNMIVMEKKLNIKGKKSRDFKKRLRTIKKRVKVFEQKIKEKLEVKRLKNSLQGSFRVEGELHPESSFSTA